MKRLFIFVPMILLAACATKKPIVVQMPHSVPGTMLPTEGVESVRYAENLKAYPISRYVDPNNQFVMHEAHTVYRVETTPKWNLHANGPSPVPTGPVAQAIDPAHRDSPITPEIIAEVNRQKFATKAILDQSNRVNDALSQLSTNISTAKDLARQSSQLQTQLIRSNERLEALEQQFRKQQTETLTTRPLPAKGTNDW